MNYTYYRRYRPQQPRRKSSFKSFFWLVVFLVLVALFLRACVSFFSVISEEQRDDAILSIEKGDVSVILWGQSEEKEASDSQIILKGDTVVTGEDSYALLSFWNGTEVAIDENSRVVFAEAILAEDQEQIQLELLEGRVWMNHVPREIGQLEITLQTDVMDVQTISGQYLASNLPDDEYLYIFEGQADTDFVDRNSTAGGKVIETEILDPGEKIIMSDNKQRALLSRENVTLTEQREDGELAGDEFVMWNLGTLVLDEPEEEVDEIDEDTVEAEEVVEEDPAEEPEVEEEIVEESEEEVEDPVPTESLTISITSPSSPASVEKDAIAIEGVITSGTAASVYVTWSGSGEAYALSLFEAGSDSFRYVADADYFNFAPGENTYTIVAYDADGNGSNVVHVVINAKF